MEVPSPRDDTPRAFDLTDYSFGVCNRKLAAEAHWPHRVPWVQIHYDKALLALAKASRLEVVPLSTSRDEKACRCGKLGRKADTVHSLRVELRHMGNESVEELL
eukprot:scaffold198238_cov39-Tisochrysis_lutea.AAC.1